MQDVDVPVVDVSCPEELSIESPLIAPKRNGAAQAAALAYAPESTRPRRDRIRRPRPDFIRDVRRLIETSWLAKVGQRWRWTPLQREYLYQLTLRRPASEVMALWDCYIERPWQGCSITHFCQPGVVDLLLENPRFKSLRTMYDDRLTSKVRRLTRNNLRRPPAL